MLEEVDFLICMGLKLRGIQLQHQYLFKDFNESVSELKDSSEFDLTECIIEENKSDTTQEIIEIAWYCYSIEQK